MSCLWIFFTTYELLYGTSHVGHSSSFSATIERSQIYVWRRFLENFGQVFDASQIWISSFRKKAPPYPSLFSIRLTVNIWSIVTSWHTHLLSLGEIGQIWSFIGWGGPQDAASIQLFCVTLITLDMIWSISGYASKLWSCVPFPRALLIFTFHFEWDFCSAPICLNKKAPAIISC